MGLCNLTTIDPVSLSRLRAFTQHACNTFQGTQQTYHLARHVLEHKIPGALVECGVAAGAQLAAMGLAIQDMAENREIHAYDSFEGIPHAGPHDAEQPGVVKFLMDQNEPLEKRLKTTKVSSCPLDTVQELWESWKLGVTIHWHKGWFQHTLPDCAIEQIAFLRLDGDLYESTLCCLEHLYHRVVPGGLVYIDDWGLPGSQKAVMDFLASIDAHPEFLHDDDIGRPDNPSYWIK